MKLTCKCGWKGRPNLSISGDHIKASCAKCYAYLKFVGYATLDNEDLKNLKRWQMQESDVECCFDHDNINDQVKEYYGDFNYCPWCGIPLKGGE